MVPLDYDASNCGSLLSNFDASFIVDMNCEAFRWSLAT
jgi:hypothetical protein